MKGDAYYEIDGLRQTERDSQEGMQEQIQGVPENSTHCVAPAPGAEWSGKGGTFCQQGKIPSKTTI